MFRQLIAKLCVAELGCEVVGAVANGRDAVRMVARLQPDLVILDLYLPDLDGFAVTDEIRLLSPATRILMMSAHCDQNTLFKVAHAGADGFLDKGTDTIATLQQAVTAVLNGRHFWSARFRAARRAWQSDPRSPFKILSDWECRVLALIAQCATDREIATRLGIAPRTVKTHRSNLLHRLGIKSTPKLIAYACSLGFAHLGDW